MLGPVLKFKIWPSLYKRLHAGVRDAVESRISPPAPNLYFL